MKVILFLVNLIMEDNASQNPITNFITLETPSSYWISFVSKHRVFSTGNIDYFILKEEYCIQLHSLLESHVFLIPYTVVGKIFRSKSQNLSFADSIFSQSYSRQQLHDDYIWYNPIHKIYIHVLTNHPKDL